MSQKFIGIDDAATQLGIPKERLNQLRESGEVRAYRDGSSWKFRTEDIDKMKSEGLPSDDSAEGSAAESSLVLDIEPLEEGDDAESILLSEGELDAPARPPSTIIGKAELDLDDSDLSLTTNTAGGSFADLDELEIDLEAESSRILEPGDVAAAQAAASASKPKAAEKPPASDVSLAGESELDILGSDDEVSSGEASDAGKTGELPSVEADESGMIQLGEDEQDDLVLGDSSDDMPLATSDSGINLAPSDSGIALDDVPLDLAGSAIGSALDLAALSAVAEQSSPIDPGASGDGDDFMLTPVADDEADEDSSQVVALEELSEEDEAGAVTFEEEGMLSGLSDLGGGGLESDLGGDLGGELGGGMDEDDMGAGFDAGVAPAPVAAAAGQSEFPTLIMVVLCCTGLTMTLCGIMALDLIQSIWSWDEPYAINSSIMDSIVGLFGG